MVNYLKVVTEPSINRNESNVSRSRSSAMHFLVFKVKLVIEVLHSEEMISARYYYSICNPKKKDNFRKNPSQFYCCSLGLFIAKSDVNRYYI